LLYLLNNEKFNREYTEAYTNASLIVREDYGFEDGLFTATTRTNASMTKPAGTTSWMKRLRQTRCHPATPRCVWNLLPLYAGRCENICGTPKADFLKVCEYIAETSAKDKTASFLYALGWTQHSVGAQNIRTMAMIQLLLGNMGMAGGGVNALRGHSNIQGLTDLGLLSQSLPGYMTLPSEKQTTCKPTCRQHAKTVAGRSGELLGQLSEILRLDDESLLWR
jgi:formate dehydrogenase major subunit